MSTVVIRADGVDITADVILADASFTTQATGSPGTCKFRIKDMSMSHAVVVGRPLTLDIDGVRVWGGFVTAVSRQFFFPYVNTEDRRPCEPLPYVPRALVVEGVDYNILFRKRFMFDKVNPEQVELRSYDADTRDDDIIRDYCENYLDLSGDGIDYTTKVEFVGSPMPDKRGNPAAGGHSWEQAMRAISRLTGAIDYIDPEKYLVHTDVDTPNAALGLSDNPVAGQVGYRDMELIHSGANLVNDALVWGAGQGSSRVKFTRTEDTASILDHGRWQVGDFRYDMWRQESVDKRSESFVYGSPQNKRGGKDDAVSVICTVREPTFRVAQKVVFESEVFGYSDVIPIRRQTVTFVSPTEALYTLVLSHYIDEPWSIFEWWFPRMPGLDITIILPDPTDERFPNCPLPDSQGTVLFSDRWDRAPDDLPEGGVYSSTSRGYPVSTLGINTPEDQAVLTNRWIVLDTPYTGSWEALLALDTSVWLASEPLAHVNIFISAGSAAFVLYGSGRLVMQNFLPLTEASVFIDPALVRGRIFVRLRADASGFRMKVWPQSEIEPGNQLFLAPRTDGSLANFTAMGFFATGLQVLAEAVTIFGLGSNGLQASDSIRMGRPVSDGEPYLAWQAYWQLPQPHAGTFFGFGPESVSLAPRDMRPYNFSDSQVTQPSAQVSFGREQFTGGAPMYLSSVTENTVGYFVARNDALDESLQPIRGDGLPTSIIIRGEVSAALNNPGIAETWGGGQPPADVLLRMVAYDYGEAQPFAYPYAILAPVGQYVQVHGRGAVTESVPVTWYPFSFAVSPLSGGIFQWGVQFHDPVAAAQDQPSMGGGLSLPASRSITASVRNVTYEVRWDDDAIAYGVYFCQPAQGGTSYSKVCHIVSPRSGVLDMGEPYIAGTVEVWADGIMLRPNVDFAEQQLPAAPHEVLLLADLAGVESLRVCYLQAIRSVYGVLGPT